MKLFKEVFDKKIPKKNYYIVFLGSLITIGIMFLIRFIYFNYKSNVLNQSYFSRENITQINTEDFYYALDELSNAILYVGYSGDYDVYLAEKKLYKEFKRKNLLDKVVYWDVTNTYDYLNLLRNKYDNIKEEITTAPLIIYIKDGEAVEAMSSELRIIDNNILDKMIDKYEIN